MQRSHPSAEAIEIAESLTFEAINKMCDMIADEADECGEAARRQDAGGTALHLRKIIAIIKANCEVVGRLLGE